MLESGGTGGARHRVNQAGSPYRVGPGLQIPLGPIPGSGVTITSITVFGGPLAIANSTLEAP